MSRACGKRSLFWSFIPRVSTRERYVLAGNSEMEFNLWNKYWSIYLLHPFYSLLVSKSWPWPSISWTCLMPSTCKNIPTYVSPLCPLTSLSKKKKRKCHFTKKGASLSSAWWGDTRIFSIHGAQIKITLALDSFSMQ